MHLFSIAYFALSRIKIGGYPWIIDVHYRLLASPLILWLLSIWFSVTFITIKKGYSKNIPIIGIITIIFTTIFLSFYLESYFDKKTLDRSFVQKYNHLGKKYAKRVYWIYFGAFLNVFILPAIIILVYYNFFN